MIQPLRQSRHLPSFLPAFDSGAASPTYLSVIISGHDNADRSSSSALHSASLWSRSCSSALRRLLSCCSLSTLHNIPCTLENHFPNEFTWWHFFYRLHAHAVRHMSHSQTRTLSAELAFWQPRPAYTNPHTDECADASYQLSTICICGGVSHHLRHTC